MVDVMSDVGFYIGMETGTVLMGYGTLGGHVLAGGFVRSSLTCAIMRFIPARSLPGCLKSAVIAERCTTGVLLAY